ncbi:MAG: Rieske 2Fe-2S domain-containing protein [Acidobacteriota bacterium]|nr:Rieske 2Fe-2S domain-containing protein [Acidobacteriota bacterium]
MENRDAGGDDAMAADLNRESAKGAQQQPPVDERLQRLLDKALFANGSPEAQKVRNFLNGTWLGEPLHVVLTDLPVGAWTVAIVFDLLDLILDRREFVLAADAAIGIGLVGAAGAAVTGMTDWSDVDPPARRLGLLHGLLNLGGTALFATSLLLRRKKSRRNGRIVSALGYAIIAYAAHLGGKMVYEHRVGVDRTDGQVLPDNFVAVLPESQLADDKPTRAMYQGVPILLIRRGGRLFAMADTCSHFGAPLSEGRLVDNSIVCPYHSSRFDLEDGRVLDGPAVHAQPCLQVRVSEGHIEVRKTQIAGPWSVDRST